MSVAVWPEQIAAETPEQRQARQVEEAREARRRVRIAIGMRESFSHDGMVGSYESTRRQPAGLDLMPEGLAWVLVMGWWVPHAPHGLYVVRSKGIPIGWACVRCDDNVLTVPRHDYGSAVITRHQGVTRTS